jgi:NAD kinase
MGGFLLPGITIVSAPTRLEGLRRRWGTKGQARFLLKRAHAQEQDRRQEQRHGQRHTNAAVQQTRGRGAVAQKVAATAVQQQAEFDDYEQEDAIYRDVVDRLEDELQFGLPVRRVDRSFVPNFDFGLSEVVVVVGQDGLVANTAKYVGNVPIVAVNPDPARIDGVLLPFQVKDARSIVRRVLDQKSKQRAVTLAQASLNDSQKLRAFNDLYIGAASHVSARYVIETAAASEPQSSSGIIVSTGAGSTGWMSSVFNMARGIAQFQGEGDVPRPTLAWEERRLIWTVREPFVSKRSQANLVAGWIDETSELVIESLMPEGGVIFSDGIESDFLPFTSGTIARIRVSPQRANLVVG